MARHSLEIRTSLTSSDEVDEAAMVAARAFHNDPFFIHLAPPALLRARGMAIFMRSMLRNLGPGGLVTNARHQGRIVGIGAWVAPDGYPYPARQQVRQLLGTVHAFLPRPQMMPDGMRYMRAIEKSHPKGPLWYLAVLATDPEFQRSGVGTALVEPIIDRCDTEGIDAYLETQKEDNLAYYRRFGFEVVDRLSPVTDGPPLWTMRRQARS
jgi:GNAT superfamily N-acetyltransferase